MSNNVRTTIMMNEGLFSALKLFIALNKKDTISSFINKAIYEKIERDSGEFYEFLLGNLPKETIYSDGVED